MQMKKTSKQNRDDLKRSNFSSRKLRRRALAFTMAALICSAGVVMAARAYNSKVSSTIETNPRAEAPTTRIETNPTVEPSTAAPPIVQGFVQGQRPTSVLESHLITISPYGFDTEDIDTSNGHFILVYENRSGLENISIQVVYKAAFLHQQVMGRLSSAWAGEFNLDAGTYELHESSHPDWVCTITVH